MNYMPRPGIVRASLCGMNVLIPSRIAGEACHSILPLKMLGNIVWTGIEKNYPMEEVLKMCRLFSKSPDEVLTAKIEELCKQFCEKGFAIPRESSC